MKLCEHSWIFLFYVCGVFVVRCTLYARCVLCVVRCMLYVVCCAINIFFIQYYVLDAGRYVH